MKLLRHLLFWCVLVLLGALFAQWWLTSVEGERVLLRYGDYEALFTPLTALAVVVFAVVAVWLLWQVLLLPLRWHRHRQGYRYRQLNAAVEALTLGRYTQAERQFAALIQTHELTLIAGLGAWRAAHARGDGAAARAHLNALSARYPTATALALAELALAEHHPKAALAALETPAAQPLPPRGLALRADALAGCKQSLAAYELLEATRKQVLWPEPECTRREHAFAAAALQEAADGTTLTATWERLSRRLREQPELRAAYTVRAAALGVAGPHEQRDANGLPQLQV